jgi:hypothetical protein
MDEPAMSKDSKAVGAGFSRRVTRSGHNHWFSAQSQ